MRPQVWWRPAADDLPAGLDLARAAIDSGAAATALDRLVTASQLAKADEA